MATPSPLTTLIVNQHRGQYDHEPRSNTEKIVREAIEEAYETLSRVVGIRPVSLRASRLAQLQSTVDRLMEFAHSSGISEGTLAKIVRWRVDFWGALGHPELQSYVLRAEQTSNDPARRVLRLKEAGDITPDHRSISSSARLHTVKYLSDLPRFDAFLRFSREVRDSALVRAYCIRLDRAYLPAGVTDANPFLKSCDREVRKISLELLVQTDRPVKMPPPNYYVAEKMSKLKADLAAAIEGDWARGGRGEQEYMRNLDRRIADAYVANPDLHYFGDEAQHD